MKLFGFSSFFVLRGSWVSSEMGKEAVSYFHLVIGLQSVGGLQLVRHGYTVSSGDGHNTVNLVRERVASVTTSPL